MTPDSILARLRRLSPRIAKAEAVVADLYLQRDAAVEAGRAIPKPAGPVPFPAMAEAAGVSVEALYKARGKSRRKAVAPDR